MTLVVKAWNDGIKRIFVRYNGWFHGMESAFPTCKCSGAFQNSKLVFLSPTKFVFIYFFQFPHVEIALFLLGFWAGKGIDHVKRNNKLPTTQFVFLLCLNGTHFWSAVSWRAMIVTRFFLACSVTRCVALSLHYRAREPRAVFTHFSPTVKTQLPQNLETTHVRRPFRCCTANRRIDKFRPRVCKHRICNLQTVIDNLKYINISGEHV